MTSNLKHIIYASTPFGFSRSDLDHILIKSRYNNDKNDITGALFCRDDLYLQYLEGPEKEIDVMLKEYQASNNLKVPEVNQPIRIALTGSTKSPSLGLTLSLFDRKESLERIEKLISFLN